MTTSRSSSDHHGSYHGSNLKQFADESTNAFPERKNTNNSNYAEFVQMVVQDTHDTSAPSSAKCEYSSNQTTINSQIRLA